MANPRHPLILQAELKARLLAEGKPAKPAPVTPPPATVPPPPKPAAPKKEAPKVLTAKDKLEALPDEDLTAKAKALLVDPVPTDRDELIAALLKAGATG